MNSNPKRYDRFHAAHLLTFGAALLSALLPAPAVFANGTMLEYTAYPPLISGSSLTDLPNVLVILDNSNSMDESPDGIAVGSDNPASKSEIARHTIKDLIGSLQGRVRLGLMSYQQSDVQQWYIHNAYYYANYDPATYDPNYVLSGAPPWPYNNQEVPNWTDSGNYVYFDRALPMYAPSNLGSAFCMSPTYSESLPSPLTVGNSYDCYLNKAGTSDGVPIRANASSAGYSNYFGTYNFVPTDSDIAEGFTYFGARLDWQYVGKTYFSAQHPGMGYLYTPIQTLDATQTGTLDNWLATENFTVANPSQSDAPIHNAGFTPIQGTLLTARNYFAGRLTDTAQGGAAAAPPVNTCGTENYVILVTDGLPSVDKNGNPVTDPTTAITEAADSAAQLLSDGIKTYVVGFGLPAGQDPTKLDNIASAGGTGTAYQATDSASLLNALNRIFLNISKRTSSGTAATVVSNSSNGTGAVYQAYYTPSLTLAQTYTATGGVHDTGALSTVTWTGGLHALFIDRYGFLREDGTSATDPYHNGKLDNYAQDPIVQLTYKPSANPPGTYLEVAAPGSDPTVPPATLTWTDYPLKDLMPIWNAQAPLMALTNVTSQRAYGANAANGRYILTSIDGTTTVPFDANSFASGAGTGGNNYRYLDATSPAQAQQIVDYIRGEEITGFRNRTIDYKQNYTGTTEVYRLGDIIHSTPAAEGAPNAGYDITQGDTTYAAFKNQYADRRQVIYVGANDGMLHAFNGGFWNAPNQSFDTVNPSVSGATAHALGAELWAYVPENLLPHLQWLTQTNYTHVYYMDGAVKTFDARIFTADADHPDGWGTILVAGMRLGGGPFTITTDGGGTTKTMTSAFVIMDVTNPEKPPRLLTELTAPQLGFTTSLPALIKAVVPGSTGDWTTPTTNQWYLVLGSGPTDLTTGTSTQDAQLYVYDLTTLSFASGFGPLDMTGAPNSFVGDVAAADWNHDFLDDAAYFGIAGGSNASPNGELDRLVLNSTVTITGTTVTAPNLLAGAAVVTLLNPGQPFLNAPTLSTDVLGADWVYAGTGRLLASADNTSTAQQSFYAVKEPVDSAGNLQWTTASKTNLADVTPIGVNSDGTITPSGTSINGTSVTTTGDVESAIQNMSGWYINLAASGPAERVLSSPVVTRQVLEFPSYTPSADSCEPEGTSLLYAVDALAGIPLAFDPLYADQHAGSTVYPINDTYDLGQGLTGQLSVTQGSGLTNGQAKLLTQNSTLNTTMINFSTGSVKGGRRSWREIDLQNMP